MLTHLKTTVLALAVGLSVSQFAQAQQLKVPAPSPSQTIKQAFGLSEITIEYSRPGVKGRTIYGDVVPFGKVWRTGANASTKITFGDDVKLEGNDVKAGTYALYSVPNKDSWELMLYKDLTLGGNVGEYKKENEVLRFVVKPSALNDRVETFNIQVADVTLNSARIELNWENTRVSFKVETDVDTRIMKNIDAAVVNDNRPYFQAASYFYETNRDLVKAAEWADKAIAQNPKAYWIVLLKAKILAKQKDIKGSNAAADQVITLATEDKNDDYIKMANKLKAENNKK